VDKGLPDAVAGPLGQLVIIKHSGLSAEYYVMESDDDMMHLINAVFGFAPGHKLGAFAGLNEYLSTLLAVLELRHTCTPTQLLQIALCIEATVPFRKPDAHGRTVPETLLARMSGYVARHGNLFSPPIALSAEQQVAAVQRAVSLANMDVGGFSNPDIRFFLRNTWNLLPESNPSLRTPGLYTLKVGCLDSGVVSGVDDLIHTSSFIATLSSHSPAIPREYPEVYGLPQPPRCQAAVPFIRRSICCCCCCCCC
jgi:hypothetical protein